MLFDTHAHLADPLFRDDLADVLQRMREAGVGNAIIVGDGAADPAEAFRIARENPGFRAAVGVHPHDADAWSPAREEMLTAWLKEDIVCALGEIGLDYHYDLSPRDRQREVFAAQLDLAYRLGLPVILHIREAHGEATEMLTARCKAGRMPAGVMHCYTGSWESAKTYLQMGLYISLSGAVTFKNAPKLTEVARNVPLERLLVETDCPYMAPVPLRGKRNEPLFVRHTAAKIAALRGMDLETLGAACAENGRRLFRMEGMGIARGGEA